MLRSIWAGEDGSDGEAKGKAAKPPIPEIDSEIVIAFVGADRGSGGLKARQLREALAKLGVQATQDETIATLHKFDGDGDGALDLEEFASLVAELRQLREAEKAREAQAVKEARITPEVRRVFETSDTDRSGAPTWPPAVTTRLLALPSADPARSRRH